MWTEQIESKSSDVGPGLVPLTGVGVGVGVVVVGGNNVTELI